MTSLDSPRSAWRIGLGSWKQVLVAIRCGCFYCPKTFQRSEISQWTDPPWPGQTAKCPYCGVELGGELLVAMNRHWFALEEEL